MQSAQKGTSQEQEPRHAQQRSQDHTGFAASVTQQIQALSQVVEEGGAGSPPPSAARLPNPGINRGTGEGADLSEGTVNQRLTRLPFRLYMNGTFQHALGLLPAL